jgi:xylan 1,4-beta-xylosidase
MNTLNLRHGWLFLLFIALVNRAFGASGNEPLREIDVNARAVGSPLGDVFKRCVGAGRANEGLRADWQRQLRAAKQACGFEYIRMHGLLCDDMGVYREDHGKPSYNWQYIDELYDFLVELKVRPFVELGFMPGALASGPQTIFWWRGNVTPPKDLDKWGGLVSALTKHWIERYGLGELKKWYFEVWNEPNLGGFWAGDQQAYFHLYSVTAQAIKAANPALRVGGPATAGAAWVPEFIDFCTTNDVPVDFITTHTYGVDVGFLDEFGGRGTVLSRNPESIIGDVKRVRAQIQASTKPNLPLHFTEWSSSYTPADPVHDSYVSAPFILEKLKTGMSFVDSMSYWTFTDIFEEAGPRFTPFHGGFGLINYQDIEKPAFRAYEYLNMLGPERLPCADAHAIATANGRKGIQVLFWNYTNSIPERVNNQRYFASDIRPGKIGTARLRISELEPGSYHVNVYRVGYRINDTYTAYLDMGKPNQLTRPQVAKLKSLSGGKPVSAETVVVGHGSDLVRDYPMRDNDVYLVTVSK